MKHGHDTEHFQGIEDTPMHRKFDLDLALMVEAGAGGGIEGLESLVVAAYRHVEAGQPDKAAAALANILQNINLSKERASLLPVAYAATVRTLNGRDVSHLSAEQVARLLDLRQTPLGWLLGFIKKKRPYLRGK